MFQANATDPVLCRLSYNGHIYTTFSFNRGAVDNSHLLPKCFMSALATMGNELEIEVPQSILY